MRVLTAVLMIMVTASTALGADIRVRVMEKLEPRAITVVLNGQKARFAESQLGDTPVAPFSGAYGIHTVTAGGETRRYPGILYLSRAPEGTGIKVVFCIREEDYVPCVLASESAPEVFTRESMKALAVVVRSYIRANAGRHPDYDVCDLTHCQVFRGLPQNPEMWRELAFASGGMTVRGRTKERIAYFSSCCGGVTEEPGQAWDCGGRAAGLSRRDVSGGEALCTASPFYRWQRRVKAGELRKVLGRMLGKDPGKVTGFSVASRSGSGRACEFGFTVKGAGTVTVNSSDFISAFGREFGWNRMPSKLFEVMQENGGWTLSGRGLGHGCGMCLYGAANLAKKGWDWMRILQFYYPEAVFENSR